MSARRPMERGDFPDPSTPDDAGAADALVDLDLPVAQVARHDRRGALFLVGELRMAVDVLADRAHLRRKLEHAGHHG